MKKLLKKIIGTKKSFFNSNDERILIEAIKSAEKGNRGEIRVHIEDRCPLPDPVERACELFYSFKMNKTRDRTGALLYIASEDRKASVFADIGIIEAVDEKFLNKVIIRVRDGFQSGNPLQGLLDAIEAFGELFREIVPGEDSAGNELPDVIS